MKIRGVFRFRYVNMNRWTGREVLTGLATLETLPVLENPCRTFREPAVMQLNYHLMDVFTQRPFAGNQLALVTRADHLDAETMQKVAREFALSETVFLGSPKGGHNTAGVRIFTPVRELPFAGHPVIGAGVLLGLNLRVSAIRLEMELGVVTCVMDRLGKRVGQANFKLPRLPEETGPAPDNEAIAHTLGISPDDIGFEDYQPCRYSAGLEYTLIPVRDRQVLSAVRLEKRDWAQTYGSDHSPIYLFTGGDRAEGVDFSCRMFDFSLPGIEDAATGSAAAALIGPLSEKIGGADGLTNLTIEQGADMGRPGLINIQIGKKNGELVHGGIGGKAVLVGNGTLDIGPVTVSSGTV